MMAYSSGIQDGHSAGDRRAILRRTAIRDRYDRRAFAGHLWFVLTGKGGRLSGFDGALIVRCSVIERAIRRLFA